MIEILMGEESITVDKESNLYKNAEGAVGRAIQGTPEMLQELYGVFYGKEHFKKALLLYKDLEDTVKVEDEADPEQLYIKGLIDGMRLMWKFTKFMGQCEGKFLDDKGEEKTNE